MLYENAKTKIQKGDEMKKQTRKFFYLRVGNGFRFDVKPSGLFDYYKIYIMDQNGLKIGCLEQIYLHVKFMNEEKTSIRVHIS